MKPRLQIIRGLPGSGKSTLAARRWPHLLKLESDFYFERGGEYKYTDELNVKACRWLLFEASRIMQLGIDFVICGVFAAHTENLDRFVEFALESGYEVWIETAGGNWQNTHGVRPADLAAMAADFKPHSEIVEQYRETPGVKFGVMSTRFSK